MDLDITVASVSSCKADSGMLRLGHCIGTVNSVANVLILRDAKDNSMSDCMFGSIVILKNTFGINQRPP